MTSPAFLNVAGACRYFGGHKAVELVSFTLAEGTLAAVIGPNGAGKTTLFNLIAAALPLTAGQVFFRGQPPKDPVAASVLGIARTFQNVRLFPGLSVLENVMTGLGGFSFWRGALRLPRWVEDDRRRMKTAHYLLENLGVAHLAQHSAGEIPFGEQRLVEIARALALKPKLLLLDEPAAGLNATETARLGMLIRRLHDSGLAILLIEHDMSLVMNLVERVIVLDQGRQIADGTPAQVRANPEVRAAYLGKEPTRA